MLRATNTNISHTINNHEYYDSFFIFSYTSLASYTDSTLTGRNKKMGDGLLDLLKSTIQTFKPLLR